MPGKFPDVNAKRASAVLNYSIVRLSDCLY
jgi:hypothetical protein